MESTKALCREPCQTLSTKDEGKKQRKRKRFLESIKKVRIKSADYTNSCLHPSANISSANNYFVPFYMSKDKKETLAYILPDKGIK